MLAVGLDAADLGLVRRLVARGHLPNLGAALAAGATTELRAPWPYRAELPWTRLLTGGDGATNGYWGTVRFDPATYSVTESGAHVADPFYALGGGPVIAFDVPHSVLSPRLDGIQVTAWGAHSPQYPRAARPAGMIDELDREVGAHPAFDVDSQPGWWSEPYLTALTAALLEGARRRGEAMASLFARLPSWRFAITVFSETHSAGHHLWHGVDPSHPLHHHPGARSAAARLEAVYRGVDEAVGRIVAAAGEGTTLVLFSVHGMQPNGGDLLALHLAPELLHRDAFGWARLQHRGARARRARLEDGGFVEPAGRLEAFDLIAAGLAGHRGVDPAQPPDMVDRLADAARRSRRVARRVRRPARPWYQVEACPSGEVDLVPGETPSAFADRPLDYLGTSLYERFWPLQRAFALPSFSDLHVRVNLRGREARGVVAADGLTAELDRVERLLAECSNARTGEPVVAELLRPAAGLAPGAQESARPPADLVVLASGPVDALWHPRLGRIGPLPYLRTGEHSAQGWAVLSGAPPEVGLPPALDVSELGGLLTAMAFQRAIPGPA